MEETTSASDILFLLSLFPAMKQLLPLDSMDFRVEVQGFFDQNFDVLQLQISAYNIPKYGTL
jgi:hypothetical protein